MINIDKVLTIHLNSPAQQMRKTEYHGFSKSYHQEYTPNMVYYLKKVPVGSRAVMHAIAGTRWSGYLYGKENAAFTLRGRKYRLTEIKPCIFWSDRDSRQQGNRNYGKIPHAGYMVSPSGGAVMDKKILPGIFPGILREFFLMRDSRAQGCFTPGPDFRSFSPSHGRKSFFLDITPGRRAGSFSPKSPRRRTASPAP